MNKTFSNFNTGISKDLELISSEGTVTERKFLLFFKRKKTLIIIIVVYTIIVYSVSVCFLLQPTLAELCYSSKLNSG